MKITFYGHSSFLLESQNHLLLFDPFITPNPLAAHIDITSIKCTHILLSHAHGDHIADVEQLLSLNPECVLISNYEITSYFSAKGAKNTIGLNLGGKYKIDENLSIKYIPAIHSSSFPDGSYGGNPGGFIIQSKTHNVIYTGDTALSAEYKLLGALNSFNIALLPIGDHFTMGYQDALLCADFLKVKTVIGLHYNTFPPITIDNQKAISYFEQNGKNLVLMGIGESIDF